VTSLRDMVKIDDSAFFLDDPYPVFARMRAEEPVFYVEAFDTFVLTKHEDVRKVGGDISTFTTREGIFLSDARQRPTASQDSDGSLMEAFFGAGVENMGETDGEKHRILRQAVAPAFSGRTMRRIEAAVVDICQELLDDVRPGVPADWMKAACLLPLRVVASLVGLPDADIPLILRFTDTLEKIGDDLPIEDLQAVGADFMTMKDYVLKYYHEKRLDPRDDLLSALAQPENDHLGEGTVLMLAMLVVSAAGGTTRALLLGMIWALAKNPEQQDMVRRDRSLVPAAIEETLRYVTPVRAFLRTALHDTEIRGQSIAKGQHVYLMYMSANRDEAVFTDAERFDICRETNSHQVAFGFGHHFCPGAGMARLEARVLLNAVLDRFSSFELAGTPQPVLSLFRNSWHDMPVKFSS
jgi:cytochrome P450